MDLTQVGDVLRLLRNSIVQSLRIGIRLEQVATAGLIEKLINVGERADASIPCNIT